MKKVLIRVALSVFSILLGFFAFIIIDLNFSVPRTKGNIFLKGLEEEVTITRDRWGVPHLFARNEKDLFFACGFVHAQERMWQMELSRRAGLGRLSEIFGRRTLERDRFIRNLGLRLAAEKDYEKLTPWMKELLLAYCDGVNSWMRSRKFDWPPEFLILGYRPHPWSPLDSLIIKELMALLLSVDFQSEAMIAKLTKKLGAERALQLMEKGIAVPPSELKGLSLSESHGAPPFRGSNNWVLSGSRTESGKPLLANDPHLGISLPPVWFEVHLVCPEFNVIGVSFPGVPSVIIGHNEFIAWGETNSYADVQDLYLERLDPAGNMYLDHEGWKPLLKIEEMIKVKGEKEPVKVEMKWTERGPIITPHVIESESPLSLSWTIYEGGRTFESFYLLNKARNWQEFQDALKLFDCPSQNFVYADREGNIGYYLSGKIPKRQIKAALFPYPAWQEGGEWQGFLGEGEKPNLFNPAQGYIVTANNKIIPDGFPHYLSSTWIAPFRADRITELILQRKKHNLESMKMIQNDVFSKRAELFLPLLKEIKGDGAAREALKIFESWDLRMSSGAGASLFKTFIDFFNEEAFKDELGEDYEKFNDLFEQKEAGLLRIISDPNSPWFDNKETPRVETRELIAKKSLEKAYAWLEEKYGPYEKWDWMRMNSFYFRHALGQAPLLKLLNRGPYPTDGDDFTVRPANLTTQGTWAASYRQVIDLSDFSKSICVLSSGESGHFWSRFYDDQIPLWLQGQYHPMLFDPEDIEANSSGEMTLKPHKNK